MAKKRVLNMQEAIESGLEVSDGYHTFDELYQHREELFILLCKVLSWLDDKADLIWRSKKHSDGTMFKGYFIMGINQAAGKQMSYHLPMRLWQRTSFVKHTLSRAPEWDGHTPEDVLKWMRSITAGRMIKSGEKLKYKIITTKKGKEI